MPEPIGFIDLSAHHCDECHTANNCPLKLVVEDTKALNAIIGEYFIRSHKDLGICVSSIVNTSPLLSIFGSIEDVSNISMTSYLYGFRDGWKAKQEMDKLESISK